MCVCLCVHTYVRTHVCVRMFASGYISLINNLLLDVFFIYQQMSTLEPIRGHLTPPKTCKEWKRVLLGRLPILIWLYQYLPSLLFGDVISGITVGIMHIPQGIK